MTAYGIIGLQSPSIRRWRIIYASIILSIIGSPKHRSICWHYYFQQTFGICLIQRARFPSLVRSGSLLFRATCKSDFSGGFKRSKMLEFDDDDEAPIAILSTTWH